MTTGIVYENQDIIIICKPAGIPSQNDKTGLKSVLDFLPGTPHPITRLDTRVSGLVLLAKTPDSAKKYSELLRNGKIQKEYQCVVSQRPQKEQGVLRHWIKKTGKAQVFDTPQKDAKEAVLAYQLLASSEKYHLLNVKISTGRFHQIRAQLAAIGSPIMGDLKYGFKRNSPDGSIFLCCTTIQISSESEINVEIPIPEIWKRYGF